MSYGYSGVFLQPTQPAQTDPQMLANLLASGQPLGPPDGQMPGTGPVSPIGALVSRGGGTPAPMVPAGPGAPMDPSTQQAPPPQAAPQQQQPAGNSAGYDPSQPPNVTPPQFRALPPPPDLPQPPQRNFGREAIVSGLGALVALALGKKGTALPAASGFMQGAGEGANQVAATQTQQYGEQKDAALQKYQLQVQGTEAQNEAAQRNFQVQQTLAELKRQGWIDQRTQTNDTASRQTQLLSGMTFLTPDGVQSRLNMTDGPDGTGLQRFYNLNIPKVQNPDGTFTYQVGSILRATSQAGLERTAQGQERIDNGPVMEAIRNAQHMLADPRITDEGRAYYSGELARNQALLQSGPTNATAAPANAASAGTVSPIGRLVSPNGAPPAMAAMSPAQKAQIGLGQGNLAEKVKTDAQREADTQTRLAQSHERLAAYLSYAGPNGENRLIPVELKLQQFIAARQDMRSKLADPGKAGVFESMYPGAKDDRGAAIDEATSDIKAARQQLAALQGSGTTSPIGDVVKKAVGGVPASPGPLPTPASAAAAGLSAPGTPPMPFAANGSAPVQLHHSALQPRTPDGQFNGAPSPPVTSAAQYAALAKGARYLAPDGQIHVKQ